MKKILPELRFPEFKDSGEWGFIKLKQLGTFYRGLTYGAEDTASNGLLVLRSGNIQDDNLVLNNNLVFVNKECPENLKLQNGDIVICMSNGSKALVGKNAEYKEGYEGNITVGAFCSILRPKNSFTKYLLQSDTYQDFIALSIGGGNINNLKNSDLEEFSCSAPKNRKEQQRIAACLSSLDELISAHSQKLELLKAHKKGLMQNLFPQEGKKVPKLRFKEFEDSGEWKEETLGKVYDFKSTNSLSREHLSYEKGIVKNIHYGDIHTTFSTLFDITKEKVPFIKYSVPVKIKKDNYCIEGDIIFADASEDIDDIGKSIEIINLNNEKLVSGLHTLLARQRKQKLAIGFGGYLFKSDWVRKQIQREAQGAKVLGISATRISRIRILFPKNIIEQQKIASCLSSLDELITAQSKKIEQLKQHKKGLMQGLFPKLKN
ncbi:restriction endonuclease subunit S [Bergeyella cardium]|uniref:restriction endonuclease subunit S n=1 Tax=Bergeyella cardium TaxID=1585976 RepID=UPI001C86D3A0|nr:restriction endonuclease subunit S [Bergeyella cardium]